MNKLNIILFVLVSFSTFENCKKRSTTAQLDTTTISVKDFGAKGNGQTDDTEAITRALKAAKENSTLYFPSGTYMVSDAMLVDKLGLKISAPEDHSAIIKFNNKVNLFEKYNRRVGLLNVYNNNITIENLFVDLNFRESGLKDGDKANVGGILVGGSYIRRKNTDGIKINNCHVYDVYGDAIAVHQSRSDNIEISSNEVTTTYIVQNWKTAGTLGQQCIHVFQGTNILIDNNKINGALDDAIVVSIDSENAQIINNNITTTGGRIWMSGTKNGLIKNNRIEYIQDGGTGIGLSYYWGKRKNVNRRFNDQVVVEDNEIIINEGVKVMTGIWLFGPGKDITVRNNKIINRGGTLESGIDLRDRGNKNKDYFFGENIKIENNEIENAFVGINQTVSNPQRRTEKFKNISITENQISRCEVGINIDEKKIIQSKNELIEVVEDKGDYIIRKQLIRKKKTISKNKTNLKKKNNN